MKTIEDQMSFYAAYHQDARNKATHFIGVPAIMLSLFIPLAWIRFDAGGAPITAAMVFAAVVLMYYFFLDVPLALAMLVITAALVWVGHQIAGLGSSAGWFWFAVLFVGGWILQLVGHGFEGRKPALADNLFQSSSRPSSWPRRFSLRLAISRNCTNGCRCGRKNFENQGQTPFFRRPN